MVHVPRGRLGAARLTALAAAVASAAALTLTMAPADAQVAHGATTTPVITGTSVFGSKTKVTSSKKQTLDVSVFAATGTGGGMGAAARAHGFRKMLAASSGGSLFVNLNSDNEYHEWMFPIPTSALAVSNAGKGSLKVPTTKISPFGKVSLTITPNGAPKVQSCQGSPSSKTQKVYLKGTFVFDTRSGKHGWGSVGGSSFSFSSAASVTWTYQNTGECYPHYTPPCVTSTSWSAYSSNHDMSGSISPSKTVSSSREVTLSTPVGANRFDSKTAKVKSATLTTTSAGTATVKVVGNGTGSTGSGTVKASGKYTYSSPCGTQGQVLKSTSWGEGTFTNGSTPLQVHDIFGAIGVSGSKIYGSVYRFTVAAS